MVRDTFRFETCAGAHKRAHACRHTARSMQRSAILQEINKERHSYDNAARDATQNQSIIYLNFKYVYFYKKISQGL